MGRRAEPGVVPGDEIRGAANGGGDGPDPPMARRRYRRLLVYSVLVLAVVTVAPLVIMTWINYHQYEQAFNRDLTQRVYRWTSSAKRSLEFTLSERLSALSLIIREVPRERLEDQAELRALLGSLKDSFGGFVDLGLIDIDGRQVSYAGPYELVGKDYRGQDWFHEVKLRGVYVSDVFMGHRRFPHFVIAVRHEHGDGGDFILRATIDSDLIDRQMTADRRPFYDAFIVNHDGVLQTPSLHHGRVLERIDFALPPPTDDVDVVELDDARGDPVIAGYASIARTPFVVLLLSRPGELQEGWLSLRRELVGFLSISIVLILAVVVWGGVFMIRRIREADVKRAALLHKMEYTNRMAVIGRLAAGVAHEINNPLAVINEKAGLMNDLLTLTDTPPPPDKLRRLVASVLSSVDRCSAITHRLLGFAKHMEVRRDTIHLGPLIEEVLGFLGKEAVHRELDVRVTFPADVRPIVSDRGQLQQVFLNIINNAFMAVADGGRITISGENHGSDQVAISIADDGVGIPEEHLESIFEPFFTTKAGFGTGLGLSITYGIVEKLGGQITVRSKVGEGTCFTVVLPVASAGAEGG